MVETPERPFPPGDYPVVVVGSGPGGLQLSYSLRRHGIRHAVISADPAPGGMFRKWPQFQRLLSWTKPHAPGGPGSRRYERADWNSLLAEEPDAQALQARHMDGSSPFPARAEMEASIADFVARTGLAVRYGCRWESTRREETADGPRFVLATSDGEYRCPVAVFAVGVAEPWSPAIRGIEHAHHYAAVRDPSSYAGRRAFIIGKRNSGFELASGLLQWARSVTLASPSPAKISVVTKSLVGVRARYVQPFEDSALGGGCAILDGAIDAIAPAGNALEVTVRLTATGEVMRCAADDVINATGFVCPLLDLPRLGVATFGQNAVPAQTDWWESATVPGIYFAGTITQGARGMNKNDQPPNSGAVQGHRYNARILARRIAETRFGRPSAATRIDPGRLAGLLIDEANEGPDLWHQRGYLARVATVSAEDGIRDRGICPLAAFVDGAGEDGVALSVEADGTGAIYPVLYVRRGGQVTEHMLPPHPAYDFGTVEHRQGVAAALARLGIRA